MERAEVALRLKAARWLAGKPAPGARKNPVVPLSHEELAQHPLLVENGISATKISQMERCVRDGRPMELRAIAEALDIPASFLLADDPFAEAREAADGRVEEVLAYLRQLARSLALDPEGEQASPNQSSRPDAPGTRTRAPR